MTFVHISSGPIVEHRFRLDSLEAVAAPLGCQGVWHRYVITQGDNTIVGTRCGTHGEVSLVLANYLERLNMRFAKPRPRPAR